MFGLAGVPKTIAAASAQTAVASSPTLRPPTVFILRMHFATVLTERGGIGISWDNEAPPIYQDVPPSPPAYSEEIGEGLVIDEHIDLLDCPSGGGGGGTGGGTGGRSSSVEES